MTPGRAHPSCARLVSRKEYRRFMRLRSRAPTTFPWAGRWLASGSGWRRRQRGRIRAGGPPSNIYQWSPTLRPHRHRLPPPAKTNSPTRGPMICRDDTLAPMTPTLARAPKAPSMSPQGTPAEVLGLEPMKPKGESPASPVFHLKSPQIFGGPPPKSPESSSSPSTRRRSPMSASRMSLELTAQRSSPETVHGSP